MVHFYSSDFGFLIKNTTGLCTRKALENSVQRVHDLQLAIPMSANSLLLWFGGKMSTKHNTVGTYNHSICYVGKKKKELEKAPLR
ncbi:hypothetical protein XENTR_v10002431 [Xenopus tropicalis]|nr:hypothetical protein XENTR_v10002431 [Xenopus tropicalis]